jgi:hypothetical protein
LGENQRPTAERVDENQCVGSSEKPCCACWRGYRFVHHLLHNSPDRADPAILKYFTMGFLL